jgi:hypothetical protein
MLKCRVLNSEREFANFKEFADNLLNRSEEAQKNMHAAYKESDKHFWLGMKVAYRNVARMVETMEEVTKEVTPDENIGSVKEDENETDLAWKNRGWQGL